MDSLVLEVTIPVEVHKKQTMRYGLEFAAQVSHKIPMWIRQWIEQHIEKHFEMTHEEEKHMEYTCERKMVFEVEVWYTDRQGKDVAVSASCHTECPGFVKGWVEQEAMKQFNQKETSCVKQNT